MLGNPFILFDFLSAISPLGLCEPAIGDVLPGESSFATRFQMVAGLLVSQDDLARANVGMTSTNVNQLVVSLGISKFIPNPPLSVDQGELLDDQTARRLVPKKPWAKVYLWGNPELELCAPSHVLPPEYFSRSPFG